MLHDVLNGGMEMVHDPLSEHWPSENAEESDGRRMLPLFEGYGWTILTMPLLPHNFLFSHVTVLY